MNTWLNPVFRPYAILAYNELHTQQQPSTSCTSTRCVPLQSPPSPAAGTDSTANHLSLLNEHLQKVQQRPDWICSEKPCATDEGSNGKAKTPVWSAEVVVNGEILGRGEGSTKKAARNESARHALVKMGVAFWCVFVTSVNLF